MRAARSCPAASVDCAVVAPPADSPHALPRRSGADRPPAPAAPIPRPARASQRRSRHSRQTRINRQISSNGRSREAQERQHAVVGVGGIDPLEAVAAEVALPQRGPVPVQPVEGLDHGVDTGVATPAGAPLAGVAARTVASAGGAGVALATGPTGTVWALGLPAPRLPMKTAASSTTSVTPIAGRNDSTSSRQAASSPASVATTSSSSCFRNFLAALLVSHRFRTALSIGASVPTSLRSFMLVELCTQNHQAL